MFIVEEGKTMSKKIHIPFLFGMNNSVDKSFNADAVNKDGQIVLEVEVGRAVDKNQFYRIFFKPTLCLKVNI